MRGLLKRGMSTRDDIRSGGADNVFTSTGTEITRKCTLRGTTIVFKPELFDRTDWYSYECDNFGRTNEDDFRNRISPEDLFRDNCDQSNENMFRTGIGPQYIEQIIVNKTEDKEELVNGLRQLNVTSFDGKTIEELIVSREELPIISEEKIERIRSGEDAFPFKNIFYSASNCDLGKTLDIMKPLITDKNINECKTKIIETVQQNYKWVLKNIVENGLEKAVRLDDDERQFYRFLQDDLGIDLKTIAPSDS